jgi:Rod binding domain-containing protein
MTTTALDTGALAASGALLGKVPGIPLNGVSGALTPQRMAAAKSAARDFEAFFVTSMLESMYAGMKPDPEFGGGSGEEMYRSLLNQEYGKAIAARGSLGIANTILGEMINLQEKH